MKTKALSRVFQLCVAAAVVSLFVATYAAGTAASGISSTAVQSQTASTLLPRATPPVPVLNAVPSFSGSFDVGGYGLFIVCFGSAQPTVIFDSDLGWASNEWYGVVAGASEIARVCIYDRAGLGLSDKAFVPRTSSLMAEDLHSLLTAAHIAGPYVLAGHGIGADNIRLFQQKWPTDVAALVLIGASQPDYMNRQKAATPMTIANPDAFLMMLGWFNVADEGILDEAYNGTGSAAEMQTAGKIGTTPLRVISQCPINITRWPPLGMMSNIEVADTLLTQWYAAQSELVSLSSNSAQVIAASAGHTLPIEEPDLVTSAIAETVSAVRATSR